MLKAGNPLMSTMEEFKTIAPPVGYQRKSLLHSECDGLNVKVKNVVVMLFSDGAEWNERTPPALAKRMSRRPFSLPICA